MSTCRCGADADPGEDFCDEHAPIYIAKATVRIVPPRSPFVETEHDRAIMWHDRTARPWVTMRQKLRLANESLAERTAERDALAAKAERLIREAGAIRNDERQRAEAEHRALADEGRQRDANRIERLEGEIARLRVIVDDADRAKAEHEKTRDELRRLHDVLSGAKKL